MRVQHYDFMIYQMNLSQKESTDILCSVIGFIATRMCKHDFQLSQNMPPYGLVTTPE